MGVLVVAGAGIAAALLRGGEDGALSRAEATSTTSTTSPVPTTSPTTGPTATTAGPGTTATTTAAGGGNAPWRSPKLARSAAPVPWLEAWGRARNRRTCALLVPSDPGPNMAEAGATSDRVNGDEGWDVYLRRGPYVIEILGLFSASDSSGAGRNFTRTWKDGSVARYGPDVDEGAFEAVLVLPDQGCGYRIYDSQGKAHLEFVLDHLRFVQGAP